jgi:cytochrome P450
VTSTQIYNPLDETTLDNPYPLYAELRENTPIFWHEQMRSWVLTRFADCKYVLRTPALFARDRRRLGERIPEFRQSLQTLDPPEQAPLRSLLMTSFHAQDLPRVSARAERAIARRLTELHDRGATFDWMAEISAPLALAITCDLIGVPEPELALYCEISEGIAYRMDSGLCPQNAAIGDQARNRLNELASGWLAAPRAEGVLRHVLDNAHRVNSAEHYVKNSLAMMFNASFGTVYATAGNAVFTLLEQIGGDWSRLAQQDLLSTAVDELIRFDGPAQGTSRVATEQTRFYDVTVRRGDIVLTLMAAANRDPRQFDDPDQLRLDRSPNPHLGFGWGPHACLGAMFGHLAIETMLRAVVKSGYRLRLERRPTRRRTATVRTIAELPVTLTD